MSLLFLFTATLVKIVPYLLLVLLPFRTYYRYSRLKTMAAVCFFIFVFILGAHILLPEGSTLLEWQVYYTTLVSLLGLLLCFFLVKGNFFQIIFNSFVVLCYAKDVDYFSMYLESYILNTKTLGLDLGALVFCYILILAFTFPFMWLFMTRLLLPVIQNKEQAPFWNFLWIIPFSFYALYHLGISSDNSIAKAFINGKDALPIQIAWTIGTFLSFGMMLQMLKENIKNELLNSKLQVAALHINLQRKEFDRLNNTIEETRRSRHNLRQHLVLIKHYVQESDLLSLESYLNKYIKAMDKDSNLNICENSYFNAIIQYYYSLAKEKGILMELSFDLPKDLSLPETDTAVLLGNMFENALEACERQHSGQRFIRAKGALISDNVLAITIKNSFDHEIHKTGDAFISSKRDAKGIGTESIRIIAERYNGLAKFTNNNGIFETSVLLSTQPDLSSQSIN
ncbi:MAG: ATP-binding protein [Acidaminococcaceae bacterium]